MRDIIQNLRFTLRQLVKSPGFTIVAPLSLGLGIGAGVAVVNAILLSSLPVPNLQAHRAVAEGKPDLGAAGRNLGGVPVPIGNRRTTHYESRKTNRL